MPGNIPIKHWNTPAGKAKVAASRATKAQVAQAVKEVLAGGKVGKRNPSQIVGTKGKQGKKGKAAAVAKANPTTSMTSPTDTRKAISTSTSLQPSTMLPTIVLTALIDPLVIYGLCLSYVDLALSRGFLANAETADQPYHASCYMQTILYSYIQGTVNLATKIPKWLLHLGQALAPKIVGFNNSKISYKFKLLGVPIPPSSVPIGSSLYGYEHTMFVPGGGPGVDLFPVGVAPNSYSNTLGEQAWAVLSQFMVQEGFPESALVTDSPTPWANNVSAFAVPTLPEGLGWLNTGGQIFQAGLEVPIFNPFLSVFCGIQNSNIGGGRVSLEVAVTGGDAFLASAFFSGLCPSNYLTMRKPPRLHPVDLLEFGDVLAIWVQQFVTIFLNNSQTSVTATEASATCPITLQEMMLLLRNEIMVQWGRSQAGVQALLPRSVGNANDNEFTPCLSTSSTCPLVSSGMKLPLMLIENVKSLMSRYTMTAKGKPVFFCPILGKYKQDSLVSSDYQVVIPNAEGSPPNIPFNVFTATPPMRRRRKDSKGRDFLEVLVEPVIDLVDGNSPAGYVFINDPKRLGTLAALWNDWISKFSTYTMTQATMSRDFGVNICSSVGLTKHWVTQTAPDMERNHVDIFDSRVSGKKEFVNTAYAARGVVGISGHDKLIDAVFTKIQKVWILPVNHSTTGNSSSDQSSFTRQSLILGEGFSVATTTEFEGISLSTQHVSYASLMVKQAMGPSNEIENFFVEMAAKGAGGILSGLVSGFIGKAFGPTAGSIANSIADILPI